MESNRYINIILLLVIILTIGCSSVEYKGVTNVGCAQNSDCDANQYCDETGTCESDLAHASVCNNTYVQSGSEMNGSCIYGECWNNSNYYICDRAPNATSTPSSIDNFSCRSWTLLNWTNSTANDPDNDTIYFNVKVGSLNGSSDYGTGTTNGTTVHNQTNATGLIKIQKYYWVLQTCDEYGYCVDYNNSDWDSFNRTNCAPNDPTNLTPSNSTSSELAIDFTWETGVDYDSDDPDYDSDLDYFCIQTKLNLTDPCENSSYTDTKTISEDNLITLDISDLSESIPYYWAVKTTDGILDSSWVIYYLNITFKSLDLVLAPGVTEILFYPNSSTSQEVEPECQTSTSSCIIAVNRLNTTVNISVATNMSYPVNYREGDTNWNFNHNTTDGNKSLWGSVTSILTIYNRSISDWALNITY